MGKRVYKGNQRGHRVLRLSSVLLAAILLAAVLSNVPLSPAAAAQRGIGKGRPEPRQPVEIAAKPLPVEVIKPPTLPKEEKPVEMPEAEIPETPIPVDNEWFSDAVFLGDSRMEGFKLYAGLSNAQYLTSVGATVDTVFEKATEKGQSGKVPIMDALMGMEFSKIYLMLGMNELGWNRAEDFIAHYARVVDRVLEINPEATVYIEGLFPVTKSKDEKKTYVNNARIAQYNALLEEMAAEKGVVFLNPSPAVVGEDGYLPENYSFDGVHLTPEACTLWREYLKTHTNIE